MSTDHTNQFIDKHKRQTIAFINSPKTIYYETHEQILKHLFFTLNPDLETDEEKQTAWSEFYKGCEEEMNAKKKK